ncbi:MAG: TetR/AcrR family transcriptional regulator [Pseudomonadales bacterium]|nr:TetR/AcrR family transcriptional regulator [Pseudomonadales bacterium]
MAAKPRKPGRPASRRGDQDSKKVLIDAAVKLFAERGFEAVSLREVAREAGVTAAMISYYFKDKQGLQRAVLESGLDRLLEVITGIVEQHDGPMVEGFISAYIHTINKDPWIPQLMVREVISRDTPYRDVIVERFASKAATMLPARLMEEIQAGNLRSDLDPRLMLFSLIGMCLFPYIAAPLLKPVFGIEFNEAFADTLAAHTNELFLSGAGTS